MKSALSKRFRRDQRGRRQGTYYSGRCWILMRKQSNGTPGKKPPAVSVSITQGERAAARLAGYRRHALETLSGAGSRGYTTLLAQMAQGFTTGMLAGLVRDGLATAAPETVRAGGRTVEITRVKITDAGRRALGYERAHRAIGRYSGSLREAL